MSADHHQHDTPNPEPHPDQQGQELPRHPFTTAWETWDAWSMANTMRHALQHAREHGNQEALARFERYPEWTKGPGPLEALAANRELVDDLTGWRWQAMRDAREQGHGWGEIGRTLWQSGEQARVFYLDKVDAQRRLAQKIPQLGYDARWLELAEPNDADRAADRPSPAPGREGGHERC